jgi:predicted alpha/beta hydrolase family esterase
MKKQILFIPGGGEGAHAVDEELAKSLRDKLGSEYNVRYTKMPEEENAGYEAWKAQISKELVEVDDQLIFVGHSVGTSKLLKYLAEENVKNSIAGIFLIAAPYWGMGGWHVDDDTVPFTHLSLHAQKFPQATVREFDGRGHLFNNDLSEVAADIKSL